MEIVGGHSSSTSWSYCLQSCRVASFTFPPPAACAAREHEFKTDALSLSLSLSRCLYLTWCDEQQPQGQGSKGSASVCTRSMETSRMVDIESDVIQLLPRMECSEVMFKAAHRVH